MQLTNVLSSMQFYGARLGDVFGSLKPRFIFGKDRAYSSNFTDRQQRITMDQVTIDRISSALYQAWLGFMAPIAEIFDLMPASNPILRGIRRQLKAGVKKVKPELVPSDDTPLAATIADDCRDQMENPDAPLERAVDAIIECGLRGGGLVEILWARGDDGKWKWTGFNLVPQQRVRFNRYTGEIAFAESAFQYFGAPVSSFPRGTFIVVTPESEIPDFSKRGTYRAVLGDWFAMQNAASWWQGDLEFVGSPIVVGTYDDDPGREELNKAFQEMGASGRLGVKKGTDVKLLEKSARTGPKGSSHNEFETTRVQRMSVAFLGGTQTVTVDANTGSQQSADNMADVRDDVLADHWEVIISAFRRDVLQVYVELNYGLENAALTPLMVVDLEQPADAAATIDAFQKGSGLGLDVGENFARKKLKWPKPAPGEKVLTTAAPPEPQPAPATGPRSVPAGPDKQSGSGAGKQKEQAA